MIDEQIKMDVVILSSCLKKKFLFFISYINHLCLQISLENINKKKKIMKRSAIKMQKKKQRKKEKGSFL